jgi:hypothetical protein
MYSRALVKLGINRQFEKVIKEVAIDCDTNKNGNIIRLEERYTQERPDLFKLYYENYSTGEKYLRMGIFSKYGDLGPSVLTLQDIFDNTAKNSNSFDFEKINETLDKNGNIEQTVVEQLKITPSLIVPEYPNMICSSGDYSFEDIPEDIYNLTLNKELIPVLMKLDTQDIKQFFFDIEKTHVVSNSDPDLKKKVKKFTSKTDIDAKNKIIEELIKNGIQGVDPETWTLYSTTELKKIASNLLPKMILIRGS